MSPQKYAAFTAYFCTQKCAFLAKAPLSTEGNENRTQEVRCSVVETVESVPRGSLLALRYNPNVDFTGTKVALIYEGKLIMLLRDNKPGLNFANMWDFPGGGRENNERPIECATREIEEEFGITLDPNSFIWQKEFPSMHEADRKAYFLVAHASKEQVDSIQFGNEGQGWDFMDIDSFFDRDDIVPHLKHRFKDYLEAGLGRT